jgi:hypothetical protein
LTTTEESLAAARDEASRMSIARDEAQKAVDQAHADFSTMQSKNAASEDASNSARTAIASAQELAEKRAIDLEAARQDANLEREARADLESTVSELQAQFASLETAANQARSEAERLQSAAEESASAENDAKTKLSAELEAVQDKLDALRVASDAESTELASARASLETAEKAKASVGASSADALAAAQLEIDHAREQLTTARQERDDAMGAKASAEALRAQSLTDKVSAEQSRDDALAAKAAAEAGRDAARRDSGESDTASASAAELSRAKAELAAFRLSLNAGAHETTAEIKNLKDQLRVMEAQIQEGTPSPQPAGGGAQAAILLQTIRSTITSHKNQIESDESAWKTKEVAVGNAIQQLLAMVQTNPSSREMVYGLLNDLQGILDAGRHLVKRNRQLMDEEESAISEFERTL